MDGDTRGVSPVVGLGLITAIVVTLSISIIVVAATGLNASQAEAQTDAAEHAFTKFDSQASLAALSYTTDTARYDFGAATASRIQTKKNGWIRIKVRRYEPGTSNDTLINKTFTNLEYRNERTGEVVVYQGGGVWKKSVSANGSTMLSTPEFNFRGRTITLPLVSVDSSQSNLGQRVTIEKTSERQLYPNATNNWDNPLKKGNINVTIKSRFYQSWGEYFEERTEADVTYDHDRNIVYATLSVPLEYKVDNAIASKASGRNILLENTQSIDAYNSAVDPYPASASSDAKIAVSSKVVLENSAEIDASLVTESNVQIENTAQITGDVYCPSPSTCVNDNSSVGGSIIQQDVNVKAPSVGGVIDQRVAEYSSNNDNANETDITGTQLDPGKSTWKLDEGVYYLSEIDLDNGDKLVLNTTEGDIKIAVDNKINIRKADVVVKGDGRVNIFMDGQTLKVYKNSKVTSNGDFNSTQFWIFGPPGTDALFRQSQTEFVGVLYAPSNGASVSSVEVRENADVYGGIVAYVERIRNSAGVHYDEALLGVEAFPEDEDMSYVTYVHITVNEVKVSDD